MSDISKKMKFIFVDKNKTLVEKVKKLFEQQSEYVFAFDTYHGDVLDYKKDNPDFLICTASNPSFTMGGGLDKAIATVYPEEVKELEEGQATDNLFPLITVGEDLKATQKIIIRALAFIYANRNKYNFILTGIGTGIGGMSEDEFINCLTNLTKADLSGADLREADLREANFEYAILRGADLRGVDLRCANLTDVDLTGAYLTGANLIGANLKYAKLTDVDLTNADLREANLREADLTNADLTRANLSFANLGDANLNGAKGLETTVINENTAFLAMQCPEEGDFIGRKKCLDGVIVKLKIPAKAKRSSATTRKCRAEYVKVLEVIGGDVGISSHDRNTIYKVGETVRCHEREEDRRIECGGGIHFFITRQEAEHYFI